MQFGGLGTLRGLRLGKRLQGVLEKWVTITDALSKFAMQLTGANKRVGNRRPSQNSRR